MKKFIGLFITLSMFYACTNNQQPAEENQIFNALEIESIGESHNRYIQTSFQTLNSINQSHLDWNGINSQQELFDVYIYTYPNKDLHTYDEVAGWLLNSLEGFDINEYSQQFTDQNVVTVYNNILEASFMSNITNYEAYESFIEYTNTQIEANFTGFDREFLLVTTSVALSSAYLWLSVEKGGLGQMDELENMYSSIKGQDINTRLNCWEQAIAADLTAASGYFMGVGMGMIVPGANVAIAKAIGFTSGFASAMQGFICVANGGGNVEPIPMDSGNGFGGGSGTAW